MLLELSNLFHDISLQTRCRNKPCWQLDSCLYCY